MFVTLLICLSSIVHITISWRSRKNNTHITSWRSKFYRTTLTDFLKRCNILHTVRYIICSFATAVMAAYVLTQQEHLDFKSVKCYQTPSPVERRLLLFYYIFFICFMEGCEAHGCEAHLPPWQGGKKRISLFIHKNEDRERRWEARSHQDEWWHEWTMFNIHSHCFHPSSKAKTVILGTLPEITKADITSPQSKLQTKTYCWAEQVVFIHNSQTVACRYYLSCGVLASQTITQSLLPPCASHEQRLQLAHQRATYLFM